MARTTASKRSARSPPISVQTTRYSLSVRRRARSAQSTSRRSADPRDRLLAGLAEVGFPAGGVSASGGGDVDVVVVAVPTCLRAVGGVVGAPPNRVLHPESNRILAHERDDLVAECDALCG